MIEIKFLGRGGQGAVVASQILAKAFFYSGFYPQAFSLFGGERRGAPVKSFLRIDRERILIKCEIKKADHLIVMSEDLFQEEDLSHHVKSKGILLINSTRRDFPIKDVKIAIVDASKIAMELGLGAIINTAILGAYGRINNEIPFSILERAVKESVPSKVEKNLEAMRRAYESVEIL